jgi:uncharacterized protein (TIGR00251 family)
MASEYNIVMRLSIKVVPNAKHNKIVEEELLIGKPDQKSYKVYLTAPAVDGKANQALIETLSEHFRVKKSAIKILRGLTARQKLVEIS